MKNEFLFNESGNLVGAIVKTEKNYQIFDNERKLNQNEYKELLAEFDKINEINGYSTFCFFDQENNNAVCNKFVLYSDNINNL